MIVKTMARKPWVVITQLLMVDFLKETFWIKFVWGVQSVLLLREQLADAG